VTTPASVAAYWDTAASTFDTSPDHGLASPVVRAAWAQRLRAWIPDHAADVLDVGCGTGSLARVLTAHGHQVTGVDLSPNMVEHARRKLAGLSATVLLGDAADPPVAGQRFDVVLCRHLLWTLPDPGAALRRWVGLLRPGGQLVLIEGRWGPWRASDAGRPGAKRQPELVASTGHPPAYPWSYGVTADVLSAAVHPLVARVHVEHLTDPILWGREITDERYALLAHV
jgi:SAM-dependent methyltransferase